MRRAANPLVHFLFVVLTVALLPGQATDGNLVGIILDATGAGIPNAELRLVSPATGLTLSAKSDASGAYRFNNVPPGRYTLNGQAGGFGRTALQNITVDLNKTTSANLVLQVGSVATSLEVTEAAALIDTTTASISSNYERRQAIDLPAMAAPLGVLNLSLLGAGVASSGGVGQGEGPSVGGQRPRNNSFNIEGVDNNRKDVTGRNVSVSNEAVAEVSVLQNQYSAEFGHSTGGQFNTIVKSGTNELHGSAYEYFQNRNLNAVDEANARQGIRTNPRYDQNNIGGTVGGPVLKNKLFYFGNYEYNPIGQPVLAGAATYAPTAEGYSKLASLNGLSKTNLDVLKLYLPAAPSASDSTAVLGAQIPIGVLPINFPSWQNTYNWLVSIDYNLSDRDQIRSRYISNTTRGIDPLTSPNLPAFAITRPTTSKLFSFSEFHTFSPRLTNELRLAYNRYNDNISSGNFQYPGLDAFPNITIEQDLNLQLGPFSDGPQSSIINTYQVVNNLTFTQGRHTLKFGFDGRKYIAPSNFVQRSRGDYGYSNLERFLLDLNPDVLAQRTVGGRPFAGNQVDAYAFINDDWRVHQNLTLNLGLRYEYKGIARDMKLQELNAVSDVPGVLTFAAPRPQKKNFAPRLGLAWSPGKSSNTSVRAGFGVGYDVLFDNFGLNAKPPQWEATVDADVRQNLPGFLAQGGILPNAPPPNMTVEDARALTSSWLADQMLPYSLQWNVGVQHVLKRDYTLEVRYVGTRGVHLYTQSRMNVRANVTPSQSLPTYLQRPSQSELDGLRLNLAQLAAQSYFLPQYEDAGFLSNITTFLSNGNSSYHGLAVEATRRFSRGLLFKGAYTWSHNIDDSTADLNSTWLTPRRPQDFQDLRPERSASMLDRRQRLTMSWVWDTPWFKNDPTRLLRHLLGNYTLAGTYTAESPQYATVQSGTDSNLNGDSAADRAIINLAGDPNRGSDVSALRNSAGQIVAYLANDPTARYIKAGQGAYANGGRNTLPTQGINNFDLSAVKRFAIAEGKNLEFRAMFWNAANHPQYTPGSINTVISTSRNVTRNNLIPGNPLFNDPTRVFESNPRQTVLVVRFTF